MTERLEAAIHRLWNVDAGMSPLAIAREREAAIVEGLVELARMHGREIEQTYIDSNGELAFNVEGSREGKVSYGPDLAAVLSNVSRRTGIAPTSAAVLPEGAWCRINHFEAERLLKIVGADEFGIDGPENAATSGFRP